MKTKLNPDSLLLEMRNQLRALEEWDITKGSEIAFNKECQDFRQMFDAFQATIGFAYDLMRDGDE